MRQWAIIVMKLRDPCASMGNDCNEIEGPMCVNGQ